MSTLQRSHEIVDRESERIVHGYIRLQHKVLFQSNMYPLFQNIPGSISSLCTLYYHLYDYFDKIHPDMKLSNNSKTIEKLTGEDHDYNNSSYGKLIIPSMDECIYK